MTLSLRWLVMILSLPALMQGDVAAENDSCRWSTDFSVTGLDGPVLAIASEETASGTRIYVGGEFAAADGYLANHIAVWEDGKWSVLEGPGGVGVDGPVRALRFWDDGTGPALYVGGDFTSAGGVAVLNIARWKNGEWSALGPASAPGVSDNREYSILQVMDILPFEDGPGSTLYVNGYFETAGDQPANGLARWNGAAWSSPMADPTAFAGANALNIWDDGSGPALYVGASKLANGQLVPLGDLYPIGVRDVTVWDDGSGDALYLAGFTKEAAGVAKWNGSTWQTVGNISGPDSQAFSIGSFESGSGRFLVAGGRFEGMNEVPVSQIAAFDGSEWHALGDPSTHSIEGYAIRTLRSVDLDGPKLAVGGDFTAVDSARTTHFALWDGSTWEVPDSGVPHQGGILGNVLAIAEWDDGTGFTTYVGGCFLYASGERANHIAKWESGRWVPLRAPSGEVGVSDTVYSFLVWDDGTGPALYVGGAFATAGGTAVDGIARWDGREWSRLEGPNGGFSGGVRTMTSWDDGSGSKLYAGGVIFALGGDLVGGLAQWNGEDWSLVGEPPFEMAYVRALQVWDDALYIGGGFAGQIGNQVSVRNIAQWDGAQWTDPDPERTHLFDRIHDLEVLTFEGSPLLYSAGNDGVQRFDGQSWSYVGPEDDPQNDWAYALESWDDGTGESLYMGRYTYVESPPWYLQRWDGSEWHEFTGPGGFGASNQVLDLHAPTWEHSLWVGGSQTTIGDIPSSGIARWTCESPCSDAQDKRLCLDGDDRFLIEIDWRDFKGEEGSGQVVPFQTGNSGLFYFFSENNWEVLVKVLDACGFNDHFWVFSAATTNVEYTLTVTDTFTGRKKRYFNPLGNAAPAVTDTAAFATCEAGSPAADSMQADSALTPTALASPSDAGLDKSRRSSPAGQKTDCTPSDTTMCLEGGRFALEIDWRDFENDQGPGYVVANTPSDDSGLFQFFGEDNWEVLVKVLDACGFNDRFWVFSAATTNVEYTLRVTDTATGETVSYFNPLGNAADAVTDTDAFSTCP